MLRVIVFRDVKVCPMGGWFRTFRTTLLPLFSSATRKKRKEILIGMLMNQKWRHYDFSKCRETFVHGQ